ncbi:helix-turn-helix domain-containing protein [Vibrio sp. DNB22_17_1]
MGKTNARTLIAQQRREKAVQLRLAGHTYKSIAEELDITEAAAFKTVKTAMSHGLERIKANSEELAMTELMRLEVVHQVLWPLVLEGDLKAIDRLHRNNLQRQRLLGLSENTPLNESEKVGTPEEQHGVIIVPPVCDSVEEWLEQYAPKNH